MSRPEPDTPLEAALNRVEGKNLTNAVDTAGAIEALADALRAVAEEINVINARLDALRAPPAF